MERLVSAERREQLFENQGVKPVDPDLAERLAKLAPGDAFVIDVLPKGMSVRSLKTAYNRAAKIAGVHLDWKRGNDPIAARVVDGPTRDELYAEQRRLAARHRRGERAMVREINGLVIDQVH